jgi:coenzyme Q-binding protein COQ10
MRERAANDERASASRQRADVSRFRRLWRRRLGDCRVEDAFAVASDIESYPQFLPGVREARIVARRGGRWAVNQCFGLSPLGSRFRTYATPEPLHALTIGSQDEPWRDFRLRWRFSAEGPDLWAECEYDASFRSALLGAFAGAAIDAAEATVMGAFERRARGGASAHDQQSQQRLIRLAPRA